eukprot:SAG31_NODE_145_length_22612_cov_5.938169_19_plen_173_part_00
MSAAAPMAMLLLLQLGASAALADSTSRGAPVDYDALIAQTHAAAAENRAELLDEWKWDADGGGGPSAQQCPDGPHDVCHARKCMHCGCHGGSPRCPPPSSPPPSPQIYAGCPNQVQCGAIDTAIATLFRNANSTAVRCCFGLKFGTPTFPMISDNSGCPRFAIWDTNLPYDF